MPLFGVGKVIDRPAREAATVKVSQSDDLVTGIAGAALWGPLLDRLGVVAEADRRGLRPIGPGGYTGGECYRALLEVILRRRCGLGSVVAGGGGQWGGGRGGLVCVGGGGGGGGG